jgi:hypothetical protein
MSPVAPGGDRLCAAAARVVGQAGTPTRTLLPPLPEWTSALRRH